MIMSMGQFIDEQIDYFIDELTPIQLPSDEEIEEISKTKSRIIYDEVTNFQLGAAWMRDKILGGNK